MAQKFDELNTLNLSGFSCYMKQRTKKEGVFLYHFKKEEGKGCWLDIISTFENIEFCLKNSMTLTKEEINKSFKIKEKK